MPKNLLEKLEDLLGGPVTAYDGKFFIWYKVVHPNMRQGSIDLRDVKIKGAALEDLIEALPKFEKTKRGKVAIADKEEE